MKNERYLLIDEAIGGDVDVNIFESLEEANAEAEKLWKHLTAKEQADRHVSVAKVDESCLQDGAIEDGEIDWTCFNSTLYVEGAFDSEEA